MKPREPLLSRLIDARDIKVGHRIEKRTVTRVEYGRSCCGTHVAVDSGATWCYSRGAMVALDLVAAAVFS